jgi:hypothetical protein
MLSTDQDMSPGEIHDNVWKHECRSGSTLLLVMIEVTPDLRIGRKSGASRSLVHNQSDLSFP